MIRDNLKIVEENIDKACAIGKRERSSVSLIAVSKTKPVSMIQEAYDMGIRDFGENKVKELIRKEPELPDDIRWHMIGHLQTNKVKMLLGKTVLIHSVDSIKLSDTIDFEASKMHIVVDGLLEVNVACEESKYGFLPDELDGICTRLQQYKNLRIKGLMTVAPNVDDPEQNRPVFEKLCKLAVDMKAKRIDNVTMNVLSMGMTGDYMTAIEEGATYIRVGTGIFGARDYGEE